MLLCQNVDKYKSKTVFIIFDIDIIEKTIYSDEMKDLASKISIIVPVYNVEHYLHRCLNSILSQTYENLEIILIDDGSSDNCDKICDNYANKDNRIIVIHKKNGGCSDARNAGLQVATGNYIGFVDSDDYIPNDMYDLLLRNLKESSADISICGFYEIYKKKITTKYLTNQKLLCTNSEGMKLLLEDIYINSCYWNKLYKKELFDNRKLQDQKAYEDMFTQHLIFADAKKIIFQDIAKYYYVISSQSIQRGGFRLNHMYGLEATRERLHFSAERYPEFLRIAKTTHMRRAFYLLLEIAKDDYKKFIHEYEIAYKEIKKLWNDDIDKSSFRKKDLLLIKIILLNRYCFPFILRSYKSLKNKINLL